MAHSLTSVPPDIKIRQDLKNGATVVCHKNSVFEVKADVLVISRSGSIESMVRQKVGASEWDRKKKKAEPYYVSDWKIVSISTFDSKGDFQYSKVYVVKVPVFNYPKKWFEEYQKMIKNLLTEAAKDHKTSITIPLLGTNAGGAPKDECIQRVMDVIFTFTKSTSLHKINIVVQDWPEFTLVQDLFDKHEKPKPKTSDEDKKLKNLADNKKKSHLMPSSNIHRTDKSTSGNRFHSLTHSNDNRKVDTSRGDNPESRHRCNSCDSRKRRSPESSTTSDDNSGKRPSRPSSTSEKQRPSNARDGGEIQNNLGFGINGSLSQRDHDKVRAEGSSVDPSSHHHSTRHGNHSEHHMRGDTQDKVVKLPTNVLQKDSHGNIRKTDLNHTKSYADIVKKNPKVDSDHNNYSNGNSFKSYNEDEGFSRKYADSHRKPQMDSNDKKYSEDRSSTSYDSSEDISKLNAEFDRARLQELEGSDSSDDPDNGSMPPNKEEEFNIRCHQNKSRSHNVKDTESEKIGSSGITAIGEVSVWKCSSCTCYATSRIKLPCHHVFCIKCAPSDESCPQCKVDKGNERLSNRAEENGTDIGITVLRSREHTLKKEYCENCSRYGYTIFELPCRHICCRFCLLSDKTCPRCKVDTRLSNRAEENGAEQGNRVLRSSEQTQEDVTYSSKKYHCKSCLCNTLSKLKELPCHHFCCFLCFRKTCQQCRAEKHNKDEEQSSEPIKRVQKSRERTDGYGRDITMVEECNRKGSVELACGCNDECCFQESEGNTDESSREQTNRDARLNKGEDKGREPSNRGQRSIQGTLQDEEISSGLRNRGRSSREQINGDAGLNTDEDKSRELGTKGQNSIERTHGDGRDITVVEECNRCKSDLTYKSSVYLVCGHTLCTKCSPKGCFDRCIQEHEGNRGQSSKERTQREGRDIPVIEECNRCKLDLTYKSSVNLVCGHTLCTKCSSKGCNDRSCCRESDGNRGQHSREQTHGHAGFNRDEENSSELDNRGRNSRRETHRDERCDGDEEKHRDQSSREQTHRDDPGYRRQSSREPTLKDDPTWRGQDSREIIVKTCFKCNVNLENNSPVQLGCGHNFCARCASQGCEDPTCKEEEDCDDDMNLSSSRLSPDHHSNRGTYKSGGNHVDTKQRNPGNSEWNGSNGNYRDSRTDNHSRREWDGRHGSHGDSNGSDIHDSESVNPKHREVDKPRKDAEPTETCAICMDDFTDPKTLEKCGHVFCRQCINNCFKLHKPVCPSCGMVYGVTIGNMPAGTMDVKRSITNIEGFKKKNGSYTITYQFYSGTQGAGHPNPGSWFKGTTRVAYLPANPEGTKVCKMLKVAFKRRLTFTIGRSTTTGQENVVTWNDIHHKTSLIGGPTCFGYPDGTYLSRVTEELASKGVTIADIVGVKDGDDTIIVR